MQQAIGHRKTPVPSFPPCFLLPISSNFGNCNVFVRSSGNDIIRSRLLLVIALCRTLCVAGWHGAQKKGLPGKFLRGTFGRTVQLL